MLDRVETDDEAVLQGESAVGKSSVVLRFCQNDFQANKEPTIGENVFAIEQMYGRLTPYGLIAGAAFLTQRCRLGEPRRSQIRSCMLYAD